uniref:Uncharacterized protein n=1 Tax=Cacopsylla melanoneura TaxID=428564 RepID=A0A8D8V541_9HEMI
MKTQAKENPISFVSRNLFAFQDFMVIWPYEIKFGPMISCRSATWQHCESKSADKNIVLFISISTLTRLKTFKKIGIFHSAAFFRRFSSVFRLFFSFYPCFLIASV